MFDLRERMGDLGKGLVGGAPDGDQCGSEREGLGQGMAHEEAAASQGGDDGVTRRAGETEVSNEVG